MNQYFAYFLLSITLVACSSSNTSEENDVLTQAQEIYTEAIAIHDEVMPRMDELVQLRQQLQAKADSLRQADSTTYADTLTQMRTTIQGLEQADEAMMQWMRSVEKVAGVEEPTSEYEEELRATQLQDTTDIIRIQEEQKEAIVEVKQMMESSIAEAKDLLSTSP